MNRRPLQCQTFKTTISFTRATSKDGVQINSQDKSRFPDDWGISEYGRRSRVAGLTFEEAAQDANYVEFALSRNNAKSNSVLTRFQEYIRDPTTSITDIISVTEYATFNLFHTIDGVYEDNETLDDAPLKNAREIQKRMREENEEVATVKPATPVMAGFTFRPKKKAREELTIIEEMRRLRE